MNKKLFLVLLTCGLLSSCGDNVRTLGVEHNINIEEIENGHIEVSLNQKSVTKARTGDRLYIVCYADLGYELSEAYVDGSKLTSISFNMPDKDINVSCKLQEIISNIYVDSNIVGGTVEVDKTRARYGETVNITVTPDSSHYGVNRALLANNSEIYRGQINKKTIIPFTMPHTDVKVSMTFKELNKGSLFGDYNAEKRMINGNSWNLSNEENEILVNGIGNGDGASTRDGNITYYQAYSNYFFFKTTIQVTNLNTTTTYHNRFGIFIGDSDRLITLGYYLAKYTNDNNFYTSRKYGAYLDYGSSSRNANAGFSLLANSGVQDGKEIPTSGDCLVSLCGKKEMSKESVYSLFYHVGMFYNGKDLYVFMDSDYQEKENLVLATIIKDVDKKYFAQENGFTNFGLYVDSASTISCKYTNYEYLTNQKEIEDKYLNKLNGGSMLGDISTSKLAISNKWDYAKDDNSSERLTSISLSGNGDGASSRDQGLTYFRQEEKDYFYIETTIQISELIVNQTYHNRIGMFIGDNNKLMFFGFYIAKYKANENVYLGRKYGAYSSYGGGNRKAITGFSLLASAGSKDNLTIPNTGDCGISQGGKGELSIEEIKSLYFHIGILYNNKTLSIYFDSTFEKTPSLKLATVIENVSDDYFANNNGLTNAGLVVDGSSNISLNFTNYNYLTDKNAINNRVGGVQ